jgi:hypothetical protein
MNFKQYLLIKLAEEASEVSQAAIKCSLFGYKSKDPREVNGNTNLHKLLLEILDMEAVTQLLREYDDSDEVISFDPEEYIKLKQQKLIHYFEVSKDINKGLYDQCA